MKKYLLLIFAMSIAATVNSQFLVDSLGNIGIKAGDSIVKSTVSINAAGDNTYDFYLQSDRANGMYINNTNGNYSGTSYGLRVYNTPNPFSEATTIAFTLPQSVKEAMICIYDMNGTQLEQIDIVERGASSVQIDGYKLNAGMYLYSLIADGNVIDTKRMVLTK